MTRTPVPNPPFPETISQLPLFGYTVYVVLRVSELALPGPVLLGLNRQQLVIMDPSSQVGRAPASMPPGHPRATPLPPPTRTPPLPRGAKLCCLSCPQRLYCSIALRDLQRLHLLSPREAEGPPGLELNYGSAENPRTIWFELPQVSGRGPWPAWEDGECLPQAPGAWSPAVRKPRPQQACARRPRS